MSTKIMVVDDEEIILSVVSDFLEAAGYEVITAEDGQKAFNKLKDDKEVSIVISDLKMPNMSGIDLLKEIKKEYPHIEVIIITAYTDLNLVLSALKEGAEDFIKKPFAVDDVLNSVAKAENKIFKNRQLSETVEKMKQQNFELLTYKSLLEKRTGELMVKQHELSDANKTITDLNERLKKKVDDQVKELMSKEVAANYGELIQGITHNMNTPLSVINSGLDILKMVLLRDQKNETTNIPTYVNRINKISGAVKNVIKIVKNTMNRSRDENSAEIRSVNINKLLSQELDFLQANMFFKHQVEKDFSFEEGIPEIKAIYSDISQIFINIIQNALDAMWNREKRVLTVKTSLEDKIIHVVISDTGCGIPKENVSKIFGIFFTTKPSEESKKKREEPIGNGLGLHMVTDLANRYGMIIDVDSEVNKGTTFFIKIPVSQ